MRKIETTSILEVFTDEDKLAIEEVIGSLKSMRREPVSIEEASKADGFTIKNIRVSTTKGPMSEEEATERFTLRMMKHEDEVHNNYINNLIYKLEGVLSDGFDEEENEY
jgi:hypothetical protein